MREILFRGKTPEGEWVEGLIGAVFTADENRKPILRDFIEIDCLGWTSHTYVYDETVGQYTGLTDKNGKKIFEGDIHKCGENLWLVTFGEFYDMDVTDYEYGWYCKKINSKHTEAFGFNGAESGYMNIIGNIHDNPELLKGGAE